MKHTGLVRESLETSNRDLQVLDEYLSGGLYVSGFSSKTSEAQIFEFLPFNGNLFEETRGVTTYITGCTQ